MPTTTPTVRLTPAAQRWLDIYVSARPDWAAVDGGPAARSAPRAETSDVIDMRGASPTRHHHASDAAVDAAAGEDLMWQVIREVREVSTAGPPLTRTDIVAAVVDATGVAPTRVSAAIAYWAAHPDEVSARLRGGSGGRRRN